LAFDVNTRNTEKTPRAPRGDSRTNRPRGRREAETTPQRPPVLGPRHAWYLPCKIAVEFTAALALLVLTAPVVVLAAVLVRLTSRGPAFYTQVRVGHHGRLFTIYKLRTMIHKCESLTGPRWAIPGDPRVTRVGHFLRCTHLDELPQLLNVLRGDMSLIGPRPERPEFFPELERALPAYRDRLVVRPGVTGLAQVLLPADTDLGSVRRKLAYDLHYIERLSPLLDLRILFCTALYAVGVPKHVTARLLDGRGGAVHSGPAEDLRRPRKCA
jgi:lipopolysaccharide/colanic/teichoic acid biosynthesis glycosyltransferase